DSGIRDTLGQRSLLSGAFDFKPTDRLTFSFDAEHIYKSVDEPGIFHLKAPTSTVGNLYPKGTLPPLLDPSENFGADWATNRAEETNLLGHAEYRISDQWNVTVDAGDSYLDRRRHFDYLTPTNLATGAGTLSIGLQHTHYENKNVRA
ncbi:hypothetical protein, partial [Klebsiella pneumoniae]|uniref:hypothetical protein n=1 Tax=Klebsiella pneumoniae TaxID=573 RepID=UPI001E4DCDE7